MAHAVAGEGVAGWHAHRLDRGDLGAAGDRPHAVRRQVRRAEHAEDAGDGAGRFSLDPPEPGVGMGGADDLSEHLARTIDVVRVTAGPGEEPRILQAPHRSAAQSVHPNAFR